MSKPYQVLSPTAPVPAPDDVLEMIVREGARKMLQSALEKEVDEFLGRGRYERTTEQRGYRNGHLPKRSIGVGMGAVEVSLPRVSDVPREVSPDGFQSEIVASYQRRSRTQARLMVRLYLEGLASGDMTGQRSVNAYEQPPWGMLALVAAGIAIGMTGTWWPTIAGSTSWIVTRPSMDEALQRCGSDRQRSSCCLGQ